MLALPRIHDHHTHVSLYAALRGCPRLSRLDRDAALALLRGLPAERLSVVLDWHGERFSFTSQELDALPPALIVNHSLHGLVLTAGARRLLRDREPELVERHTDPEWVERNVARTLAWYGELAGLTPEKLDAFLRGLEAKGVGSAEDMLLTGEDAWRVMGASRWAPRVRFFASPEVLRALPAQARSSAAGVKLFLDGALGARTAALSEPYREGSRGLLLHSDEALKCTLVDVHGLRKPVALHAIGDLAIAQALGALMELDRQGLRFPEVRLEHAQFIREDQARVARDLGVVLSMQPNFNSESADDAERLTERWREANNPFRMLIDRCGFRPGHDLVFGSDGMPHGIDFALRWSLFPDYPGQRMEVDEVLAGYGASAGAAATSSIEVDEQRRLVRLVRA